LPGDLSWVKGTLVAVPQIKPNLLAVQLATPQT
jgi:hypothetical protein